MVAAEFERDVRFFSIVQQHYANVIDGAPRFVDALANNVGFVRRSKSNSPRLLLLETLEPRLSADDENIFCLRRAVAAPFGPVWTSRLTLQYELVEEDVDIAAFQTRSKVANALSLLVIGLPITDENL
jgi:hypothetical protein